MCTAVVQSQFFCYELRINEASGGAIGTGLIIGTGQALVNAGPASILMSYSITGLLCYAVMCALGEMATWFVFSYLICWVLYIANEVVLTKSLCMTGYLPLEGLRRTLLE